MMVAECSGALAAWEADLAALRARIGSALPRAELRATAAAFVDGLLSGVSRKMGWMLAEQAGREAPYRMQSLLGRSRWSGGGRRSLSIPDVVRRSASELPYLLARLLLRPPVRAPFILASSTWRRRHQAAAARCHRKRHPQQTQL